MADDPYTTLGPIPYELSVEEQRDAQLMLQQGMLNTKITLKTWAIVAAISIAALNDRILSRESEMGQALLREALICQVRWAEATQVGTRTEHRAATQRRPGQTSEQTQEQNKRRIEK